MEIKIKIIIGFIKNISIFFELEAINLEETLKQTVLFDFF